MRIAGERSSCLRGAHRIGSLVVAFSIASCGTDRTCADEPSGFEISMTARDLALAERIVSIAMTVGTAQGTWSRTYEVGRELRDGETSLFVDLRPAFREAFGLSVAVTAHEAPGAMGRIVGSGSARSTAQPNACNVLHIALDREKGRD